MKPPSASPCFVFNGDADGLIAQHLMELNGMRPATRITGLKRDIALLNRPPPDASEFAVFDISFDVNRAFVEAWLRGGARMRWFDHHDPGEPYVHAGLETHIHTAPGVCTALIVHRTLASADVRWAAAAAFGDNLTDTASALLLPLALPAEDQAALRELGELLNYNAYGETERDVLFPAAAVAERLAPFADPLVFHREGGLIPALRDQCRQDETHLQALHPAESTPTARIYHLPAEAWARRLGSTFANRLVHAHPEAAVAVIHPLQDGNLQVSLRTPKTGVKMTAAEFAKEFATGGGRARAAGINRLPADQIALFHRRFLQAYGA